MERCRFCNCIRSREFCENIFDNKQTDPTIPKIVELLTNLKIVENDHYTKFVCFNCFNILIIFYHYRERVLETNELLLKNEINTNQNNVEDFHEKWPRIKQCDDGQFVVYNNDSGDCKTNLHIESDSKDEDNLCPSSLISNNNNDNIDMFLESKFDDGEDQRSDKNKQHANVSIDNDKETIMDVDNKKNCNNDDDDKNNQKLLKNSSCIEQPLDFSIKDEINIEEICLKIENDINDDEDQKNYENNLYPSYDDDVDDKTIINFNQISDNENLGRYPSDIIKDESITKEFPSIAGSDSEDEDNQPLSILIGDNKKIRNSLNIDVAASDEIQGHHKNNRLSNKPLDDFENKTTGNNNNNNSDKQNINISVLNEQQTGRKRYYPCNICNKNFSRKSYLRKHLLRHTGEKRYKCKVCNKEFITSSALKKHSLIHIGEKSYQCYICTKRFTQKSSLQTHLKIHTGERPYQCDICNRRFTQNGTLKKHLKVHTDETSYQCNICNMRFSVRMRLKIHLKVHSGEKSHQCNFCDKKFTYKYSLKRHLRLHTGEKPYQCDICYKRFIQKEHLKNHLKVHTSGITLKV